MSEEIRRGLGPLRGPDDVERLISAFPPARPPERFRDELRRRFVEGELRDGIPREAVSARRALRSLPRPALWLAALVALAGLVALMM
jgi:hypothetical protein